MEYDSFIDFISLVYISIWYDHMFCDISVAVTTYMAVQRCCCVAMPLHFRSVFTNKRTAQALTCISGAVVVTYLPVFATQGLQVVNSNATSRKLVLWLSPRRPTVQGVNDVINKIILRSAAQIIVAVCLVVLAVHLMAASKFRRNLRSSRQDGAKQRESPASISRPDLQVIKSVTLVSVMFVLSNCPRLMFTYARRIEPEFNVLRAYENLYYVLSQVCNLAECMNASLTICVYVTHNSRFAAVLRKYLCCHSDSVDE
ncbi:unnamed protein product [Lymnaea stagnalis]|uniref:G-protein coupled receptors family 1 profile domain-containing protein n=1 Tax=Lymnaea stagnalis TaxID=6523 RepID=A0AAV2HCU0_LYMST